MNNAVVTINIKDNVHKVKFSCTTLEPDLFFSDYVDACRRAALAIGFSESLVNKYFKEIET